MIIGRSDDKMRPVHSLPYQSNITQGLYQSVFRTETLIPVTLTEGRLNLASWALDPITITSILSALSLRKFLDIHDCTLEKLSLNFETRRMLNALLIEMLDNNLTDKYSLLAFRPREYTDQAHTREQAFL